MPSPYTLSTRNEVVLDGFPYKWVPFQNFFDPNVPGYPLYRIHVKEGDERAFGVPMTKSVNRKNGDGTCELSIDILANCDLDNLDTDLKGRFVEGLRERLGLSEALSETDLLDCCFYPDGTEGRRHGKWRKMIELVFPRLQKYYGNLLPCGQFYSRTYGLFRLVSTWNVPGGEKQELIMTSNLLKTAGKQVDCAEGEPINMFLLPTYEEVLTGDLDDFPEFRQVKEAIEDFGDRLLTHEHTVGNTSFSLLDRDTYVPINAEKWNSAMEDVDRDSRETLIQLKEDMNRNYQRPFILFVYLYNALRGLDYSRIRREEYAEIYRDRPRTIYPKVLGMVLQQAFANYDCIPVDTWVETFFKTLLATPPDEIPESGRELGKFERFVWYTSQLRKTNQPMFDEVLHCIKTGVLHSKSMCMREANPLSCYLCALSRERCSTYEEIKTSSVAIVDRSSLSTRSGEDKMLLETPAKRIADPDRELYLEENFFDSEELRSTDYIVLSRGGQAQASYKPVRRDKQKWRRTDDMSPFTTHIPLSEGVMTVSNIVNSEVP